MKTTTDPIRLSDLRDAEAAPDISRAEAERQFKFSFALVIILTLGTLAAIATLPMTGWENDHGYNAQVAAQPITLR